MEADDASDGENHIQNHDYMNKISNSSEGLSKPKRQMKTPFQLETLENAFALDAYPRESVRAELSVKLGLTDRQLQMWFCHRRLKDKREQGRQKSAPAPPTGPALPDSPIEDLRVVAEPGSDYGSGSGSGSGSSPFGDAGLGNVVPRSGGDDMSMMRRYSEPSRSIMELRAIACVESQLGEPVREDGPILGIEFDPLPPDAFGAPIVAEHQKRSGHSYGDKYEQRDAKLNKATARAFPEYPFMPDQPNIRADAYGPVAQSHYPDSLVEVSAARTPPFLHGHEQLNRSHNYHGQVPRVRLLPQQEKQGVAIPFPAEDNTFVPARDSLASIRMNSQFSDHPIVGHENLHVLPDGHHAFPNDVVRMERKRKSEEVRLNKEAEARMQKELEKQDILKKKNEERTRKEMEKQDRERRKEEERLLREKQREEERLKREERREHERREKFMQREYLRAEKRRQKEAIRKEKEAVRRKAAIEKATARRIARESMELIEDEQLELMELAAGNKGLTSILSLDHDTLQNLESFRDYLGAFPPKSVQLKKPFSIQPWINSEENIGNLLMDVIRLHCDTYQLFLRSCWFLDRPSNVLVVHVWRFFITFSDALELWPFTLDEFVQALHDYDSRLLGEIHICLLRLIVKDIEDVARTPSSGLGMNQNGVANTGGGHPQIVEGAYAWGFDIRDWQKHLNPLTWPEILRQLGLSAGFGPQLKKRSSAWSEMRPNDEAKCGEDIVSTLRNGSAAENAFAIMQEKGLLAPRRSRHRLTPGTVKFAAFHVLSLEGSEGLTVLELAEKIQRSGLRDLSTSRTPEASISVALTRDTKLFERIAPSTYRVRAPYWKYPDDAEEILSIARKKIQVFQNGFLAGEDADDVERDEESECDDIDEDPEVDDVATTSLVNEDVSKGNANLGVQNENFCLAGNPQSENAKDIPLFPLGGSKDTKYLNIATEQYAAVDVSTISDLDQENMEIDESKEGESWIQGLTEGEYHDLSVEERLNALVVLTSIVNEGNSIRLVLEDRLEAANAVKKQMLAEAQIDKYRIKEEIITKSDFPIHMASKVEMEFNGSAMEGGQSPLVVADNKNNEATPNTAENLGSVPNERASLVADLLPGPDNFLAQQCGGHASKRSRSQLKSYIAHRAEEMYTYRSLPLGRDRRRNRYWQFVASSSSNDPGSGRIFVEMYDGKWRLIDSEEGFDALSMALDTRGIRESHLRIMLQMVETSFKENVRRNPQCANVMAQSRITLKNENDELSSSPDCNMSFNSPSSTVCGLNLDTMVTSSSFRIELGKNENEKKAAFKRYQDLQRWILSECFNTSTLCAMKFGEKRSTPLLDICVSCLCLFDSQYSHCSSCHQTFGTNGNDIDLLEHKHHCDKERKHNHWDIHALDASLPLKSRLLKALLAFIEVHVPSEAFQSFWTEQRKDWGVRMKLSSSVEELLQIVTLFESFIERDFLKSDFMTTDEHLRSCSISGNVVHEAAAAAVGSVLTLPWIPRTSAAVALRLCEVDSSIYYVGCEKPEPNQENETGQHLNFSSRYVQVKNDDWTKLNEMDYDDIMKKENSAVPKSSRNSYKRGRGSLDYGRRKRSKSSRVRQNVKKSNQGQRALAEGARVMGARGRRTVRKRRAEKSISDDELLGLGPSNSTHNIDESPKDYIGEWEDEKLDGFVDMEDEENANNVGPMDSDEDGRGGAEYDQGIWEFGVDDDTSNRWTTGDLGMASEEDADLSEDYNGTEEGGNDDMEEDYNGVEEGGNVDMGEELDVDTTEDSDCSPNRIGNNNGVDSAVSDDYSD